MQERVQDFHKWGRGAKDYGAHEILKGASAAAPPPPPSYEAQNRPLQLGLRALEASGVFNALSRYEPLILSILVQTEIIFFILLT